LDETGALTIAYARFTLTMWDVKDDFLTMMANVEYMFYLNYVGCKVLCINICSNRILRFTLTMWDVKFIVIASSAAASACFTLTMWDVKAEAIQMFTQGLKFYLNYVGCKVAF